MASNSHANDAMIRRLESELEERNTHAQGIVRAAQDQERDLNENENTQLADLRNRMSAIKDQLETLESTAEIAQQVANRAKQLDVAISTARRQGGDGKVEYRSAGAYMLDVVQAASGSREARERLEVFERVADHQKTGDNLGVVPDPIAGSVIDFVDASRPIVGFVGPMGMPAATWHRPKVTQRPAVAAQGAAGAAADEKSELVSQRMLITRLTANAKTFGGYVNVSRQNIDFSSPQALDIVINSLASEFAIETEAEMAAVLATTVTAPILYGATPTAEDLSDALWEGASVAYSAVKGQGRLVLAIAPDRLRLFGPLFQPVNPRDAQSPGLEAGRFGQGLMGQISGIPVLMSAGLAASESFLFSTAAIEPFEQRIGVLQAIEPSVLGVQVAYAGYFTALKIEDGGIVPLNPA